MSEPSATYSWVAGPDSAREAARNFMATSLRRRRVWVVFVIAGFLFAYGLGSSAAGFAGPARVLVPLLEGFVASALVVGGILASSYRSTLRRFRTRIPPGTELRSSFDDEHIEFQGPLEEVRLTIAGLTSVRRSGDWVRLRQAGSPVSYLWPAALFPSEELARVRARLGDGVAPGPG